ncbi:type II secretion system minor pseudopilin GspH [Legionella worsleiensis]|uniref:Type II secretion system protein H n=2 Tax=Legionella worsleiensis TaxID=45076 RepID=A0A0W1AL84_9GAMM|nr:general secretion pathway protein LspH [Legionella worsleiensis]STY30268.1 general secretion pathway protein LspH [Legionella worsleiensis]
MRRLVIGMTTNRGFTLIEILIVIVILGITAGFALISFGDFGESKRIRFAAEQMANAIRLAQHQAILESSTMGLRIDSRSYQILKFQESGQWSPISNKGIFKINYFPKNAVITLKTGNKISGGTPAIIINSSGDMTPFVIMFANIKEEMVTTLTGTHNGTLSFDAVKPQ